jgi:NitT/TauT family transport system ATP-binding protein
VRLVVIPPLFLVDALRAGEIDGFCVGEPWNSAAVAVGAGAIIAPTTAIWPLSPEKVLGCRVEWAQRRPQRLAALLRALHRAAEWCEREENHADLATLLSDPRYVGAPAELLHRALSNRLVLVPGEPPSPVADFYVRARHFATFPWTSHAVWFYSQMVRWQQVEHSSKHLAAVRATYRPDLYRQALTPVGVAMPSEDTRVDRFFDGETFEASQ